MESWFSHEYFWSKNVISSTQTPRHRSTWHITTILLLVTSLSVPHSCFSHGESDRIRFEHGIRSANLWYPWYLSPNSGILRDVPLNMSPGHNCSYHAETQNPLGYPLCAVNQQQFLRRPPPSTASFYNRQCDNQWGCEIWNFRLAADERQLRSFGLWRYLQR